MDTIALLNLIMLSTLNYYVTTFSIWFGHWFSHLKGGPLTSFHAGHHALYPDSQTMRSEVFLYASGKHDSNFALVPWLVLQAALQYLLLPLSLFLPCLLQTTILSILIGYIHLNFHLLNSRLERFGWFRRARRRHELHHDADKNFMVADHFWDRLFGTFSENPNPIPLPQILQGDGIK